MWDNVLINMLELKYRRYLVNLLKSLVNVKSVAPETKQISKFLKKEFKNLALKIIRYPIGGKKSVQLVSYGNGKPVICLNAHADTVPPSGNSLARAIVKNGKLYGLGSCDDKASLASMIAVLKILAAKGINLKGTVNLLISTEEESGSQQVKKAIENGYRCDYAIVGEPTNLAIIHSHAGLVFLELNMLGQASHGSVPWEGINAIEKMNVFVGKLRREIEKFPADKEIGPCSLNLGALRGGDIPNRVPAFCQALVDLRFPPPLTPEKILKKIDGILNNSSWKGKTSRRVIKTARSMLTPRNSFLVRKFAEVTKEVTPRRWAKIKGMRGWTEAEPFRNKLKIPAIVFGPGDPSRAHADNEFVDLNHLYQATEIYLSFLTKTAKPQI